MGKISRWTMINARIGCEERVRESGETTLEATAGEAVGGGGTGLSRNY